MGKTIHAVSNAAGTILKASKSKEACEAYIDGCLGSAARVHEPAITPNGDPAMLYKVPSRNITHDAEGTIPAYDVAYTLTTLRLS